MTGNNIFLLTIEAASKIQAQNLQQIDEVENCSCTVTLHPKFNYCKGIIYIYECDIEEIDEFRDYLGEKYNVIEIQPATFIRTRDPKTKAFIVTFNQDESPHSLYIPGERQDTKVYSFGKRPILCNNCLSNECQNSDLKVIEKKLQHCLSKIVGWTETNGFRFSFSKTKVMHFTTLPRLHNQPQPRI